MYYEQQMQVKVMLQVQTFLAFSPMPFCLPAYMSATLMFEMTFGLQVHVVL